MNRTKELTENQKAMIIGIVENEYNNGSPTDPTWLFAATNGLHLSHDERDSILNALQEKGVVTIKRADPESYRRGNIDHTVALTPAGAELYDVLRKTRGREAERGRDEEEVSVIETYVKLADTYRLEAAARLVQEEAVEREIASLERRLATARDELRKVRLARVNDEASELRVLRLAAKAGLDTERR